MTFQLKFGNRLAAFCSTLHRKLTDTQKFVFFRTDFQKNQILKSWTENPQLKNKHFKLVTIQYNLIRLMKTSEKAMLQLLIY